MPTILSSVQTAVISALLELIYTFGLETLTGESLMLVLPSWTQKTNLAKGTLRCDWG